MYFGRYQQGDEVVLKVLTRSTADLPVSPDTAPVVQIFGAAGLVQPARNMGAIEPNALTGLFGRNVFLNESFPVGHYLAYFVWKVSGVAVVSRGWFEVIEGGDPSGRILAMTYFHRPQADFYVQQRSSGQVYKGKNPRI